MLALPTKSSLSARAFPPIPALVNAQICDDHGGFGDDRNLARGGLEPARCSGMVRGGRYARLTRNGEPMRGFDQVRCRSEQPICQLPIVVVHGSLADIGKTRFLCRESRGKLVQKIRLGGATGLFRSRTAGHWRPKDMIQGSTDNSG
jgi:hypothetical protein